MEDIVIAGIAGKLPESENLQEFWENLINGVDMVTEDDRRWKPGKLNNFQLMVEKETWGKKGFICIGLNKQKQESNETILFK